MSVTGARNHRRASTENIGLPNQRCVNGIAPGSTRPPPASQPAALHEVVARAQLLDELRQFAEIVAVVGVAHHDEAAPRRLDASHQRGAVPGALHRHDARALAVRDLRSSSSVLPLSATMISPEMPALIERRARLPDARRERVRLVQTGHHDRHFDDALTRRSRASAHARLEFDVRWSHLHVSFIVCRGDMG